MENHSLEISRPEQPLEGFPDPQFVFFFFPGRRGLWSLIISSMNGNHICVCVVLSKFKVDGN